MSGNEYVDGPATGGLADQAGGRRRRVPRKAPATAPVAAPAAVSAEPDPGAGDSPPQRRRGGLAGKVKNL